MYSLTRDFRMPGPSGKSSGDRSLDFTRFMALLRPWIKASGSALDVEEVLNELRIPTSEDGWADIAKLEVTTALELARVFGAMPASYLPAAGTAHCSQIVPWLAGKTALNISGVPLQAAYVMGANLVGEMVTGITFTAAPAAYANLTAAGVIDVATKNVDVRTAGLLSIGQDAIEVGTRRVVLRAELFDQLLPTSLQSTTTRSSAPWVSGISVSLQSNKSVVNTIVGTVPQRGDIYRNGTSVITVAGYDALTGEVAVTSITNAPAFPAVFTHVDGVRSMNVTVAPAIATYGAAEVIRNGDTNDGVNGPLNGSPFPAQPLLAGQDYVALYRSASPLGNLLFGGDSITGSTYTTMNVRDDARGALYRGLATYSALLEQAARGVITDELTANTVYDDSSSAGLFHDVLALLGAGSYYELPYTGSNGTTPTISERMTLTGGTSVANGIVVKHAVSPTVALAGTVWVAVIEDPNDAFAVVSPLTKAITMVGTTSGHTSAAVFDPANPAVSYPPYIGDVGAGTIGAIGPKHVTPSDEFPLDIADMTAARMGQFAVAGGAQTLADRPDIASYLGDGRSVFVQSALAWMDKIAVDNAADAVAYPNTLAKLLVLGWPSWISGTLAERVDGLILVDPTQHDKYLTDLAIVSSGHDVLPVFVNPLSAVPPVFTKATAAGPGYLALRPDVDPEGMNIGSFFVTVQTNEKVIQQGAMVVTLPKGLIFTSAEFVLSPNVPANSKTDITGGGRTLHIVFDDTGGATYAASTLHNLVRCSIQVTATIGDPARAHSVSIRPLSGWIEPGFAAELASTFVPSVQGVVTELM